MKRYVFSMALLAVATTAQVSHAVRLDDAEAALSDTFNSASKIGGQVMDWAADTWYTLRNPAIPVCIVTGSEKRDYLNSIKGAFEKKYSSVVTVVSMGSLEGAEAIINGTSAGGCQPTIWSPASSAYENLVKAKLNLKKRPGFSLIVPQTVKSPMVLVMRSRVYRALAPSGAFKKIGNREYFSFSKLAEAMSTTPYKFTVTNPGESNSGFLSLLLTVAEATKKDVVEAIDLDNPDNLKIAKAFFPLAVADLSPSREGKKNPFNSSGDLFNAFLSTSTAPGIVTYESLAVDAISKGQSGLKVLYPETNVMSDHPAYVMTLPTTGMADDQKKTTEMIEKRSKAFALYLLEEAQQREAVKQGFRQGILKTKLNVDVKGVWPDEVFSAGVVSDMGDDNVLVARKIDGETIELLKDTAKDVFKK